MTAPLVEQVANAVLYEGYLLYPYRASAIKNRQRWNFGVVYPKAYGEGREAPDIWEMQTQCLALGGPLTEVQARVRFLRLVKRQVGRLAVPVPELPPDSEPVFVPSAEIEVDGRVYEACEEAAECEMKMPVYHFVELAVTPARRRFRLEPSREFEALRDPSGKIAAVIVRTQDPLDCWIEMSADETMDGLFRLTLRISNHTPLVQPEGATREDALAGSLLSAHTILTARHGEFVSLLEPPDEYKEAAAACCNLGTWPVLAGEPGRRDTLLSSPIILYDYPQVAPESPGDLFDGAEIDEILSLRILTLTDEEKDAIRRGDERARRILERTESLPAEHFQKLHGALRGIGPSPQETS